MQLHREQQSDVRFGVKGDAALLKLIARICKKKEQLRASLPATNN